MKIPSSPREFLNRKTKIVTVSSLRKSGLFLQGCSLKQDYIVVIENDRIFDGPGDETPTADIGITGDKISLNLHCA